MIEFERTILDNGLTLLAHSDPSTPLATVNILYRVGARDEDPARTGFAHLFEHLMFGGTKAVPDYDGVVNGLGGESNAFTNNDYTNYYLTVPAQHLETALRLEADRMCGLDLSQHALEVQQQVVTEEYHQRYLNQPYGDKWLLLRPLCYKCHPYRWPTIGADITHVKQASLSDVEDFFVRYYRPENAIIAVAGNIDCGQTLQWVRDYFGPIKNLSGDRGCRRYPEEPEPQQQRRMTVRRAVPSNALYKAFLMCDRHNPDFFAFDMISDILSNGDSSRLHNALVRQQALFTSVDAYITGEEDKGLFVVDGKLCDGIPMDVAEKAVDEELRRMANETVGDYEVAKVANKYEATFAFSQYKAADKAQSLCYYEWLGDVAMVNDEPARYRATTPQQLRRVASDCFQPHRACCIEYYAADAAE